MNGNSSTVEEKFSWWQVLEIDPIESSALFPSCGFLWQSPCDLKKTLILFRKVEMFSWDVEVCSSDESNGFLAAQKMLRKDWKKNAQARVPEKQKVLSWLENPAF